MLRCYFTITGYANEVGEAFRSQVHVNVVRASYGVACAYVVADAVSKGREAARVCKKYNRDCPFNTLIRLCNVFHLILP